MLENNFDMENSPFNRLQKAMEINRELQNESDRGCCLIASSLLESELEHLLKCKLIGNNKHQDTLFSFNGPIGTFSAKIKLSYSLGLICKEAFKDLEIIRRIRNKFGHSFEVINFETVEISNEVSKLKAHFYSAEMKPNSRAIFTNTFVSIIGQLWDSEASLPNFIELKTDKDYTEQEKEETLKFAEKYFKSLNKK